MKKYSMLMFVLGIIGICQAAEEAKEVPFTPGFDIVDIKKGSATGDIMLDEKGIPFTPVVGDGIPDFVTPVLGSSPDSRLHHKEWLTRYAGSTPYHPEGAEQLGNTEEVSEGGQSGDLSAASPHNLTAEVELARVLFTPTDQEKVK